MTITRGIDFVSALRRVPYNCHGTKAMNTATTWTEVFKIKVDLTNVSYLVFVGNLKFSAGNGQARIVINTTTEYTSGAQADGFYMDETITTTGYSGVCDLIIECYNSGANDTWVENVSFYNKEA